MEPVAFCPCGHAIDHHEASGCVGDRARACPCREDAHEALLAAIAARRSAELAGARSVAIATPPRPARRNGTR